MRLCYLYEDHTFECFLCIPVKLKFMDQYYEIREVVAFLLSVKLHGEF